MSLIVRAVVLGYFLLGLVSTVASADQFDGLARNFWAWRAIHQPLSSDDIPRIERPADWIPDWSQAAIAEPRHVLSVFEDRWKKLEASQ